MISLQSVSEDSRTSVMSSINREKQNGQRRNIFHICNFLIPRKKMRRDECHRRSMKAVALTQLKNEQSMAHTVKGL
jgi:hypothetical protein